MSDEAEISSEVDSATRALEMVISAHLAAGTNRCVLAAACVWRGVMEMSEVTNARSAAAALRSIADQIDPPMEVPMWRSPRLAERGFIGAAGEHRDTADRRNAGAAAAAQAVPFNQQIASNVISEAIDMFDQGHPAQARALLMALRVRFFHAAQQSTAMR